MTGREAEKSAGAGRRKRRVAKALEEFDRDNDEKRNSNGDVTTMARFDMLDHQLVAAGGNTDAEIFCEMGLMYATGRECEVDVVAAHKWLNIAAIKGSDRAAELRADLAATMTKTDLAAALRSARDWMTMH